MLLEISSDSDILIKAHECILLLSLCCRNICSVLPRDQIILILTYSMINLTCWVSCVFIRACVYECVCA